MYLVKAIKVNDKISNRDKIYLLVHDDSCIPAMYPFLYSLKRLRYQSYSVQNSDLLAIKFWYKFWYQKKTQFCHDFYNAKMDPYVFLREIDSFIIYLENNKKIDYSIIRLKQNGDINYETIAKRLRSLFKFFVFLLDEYFDIRNQNETRETLILERKKIDLILKRKKSITNNSSKIKKHNVFKSLSDEMTKALYDVCSPVNRNHNNPFSKADTKHRNF